MTVSNGKDNRPISVRLLEIYRFLDEQMGYSDELIAAIMGISRPSLHGHKLNGFADARISIYEITVAYMMKLKIKVDAFLEDEL